MVNGKVKGGTFERQIYKDLRDYGAKRSLGSGSSDEAGDITLGKCVIECKRLKKMSWKMLEKFFEKLKQECEKKLQGEFRPFVIFKTNNDIALVYYEGDYHALIIPYSSWKYKLINHEFGPRKEDPQLPSRTTLAQKASG